MNRFTAHIIAFLLVFCAIPAQAVNKTLTHTFASTPMTFENDNKVGRSTTSPIVYTCGGTSAAEFGSNYPNPLSIKLLNSGDHVIISPALKRLGKITLTVLPNDEELTNIKIYISEDGSNWGSPITANYGEGSITATFTPDAYYVKIANSNSTNVFITAIQYRFDNCNCFTYTPE